MAGAQIDPDEVERFAITLRRVTDDAAQQMRQLQVQLDLLPDHWRDQHYEAFREQMNRALADFDRFRIQAEDFLPWIAKKVVLARAYMEG